MHTPLLPILISALSIFFLGGLWYSEALFGNTWNRENGRNPKKASGGHGAAPFVFSFLFSLASAAGFSWIVGPRPELTDALKTGALIGVGFVATSFGINYQFGARTAKLLMIDAGYHVLQYLIYGLVFGLFTRLG